MLVREKDRSREDFFKPLTTVRVPTFEKSVSARGHTTSLSFMLLE